MSDEREEFKLDAGFWRATAVLAAITVAGCYGVVVFPIEKYLPEAVSAAKSIDFLFKFMAFFSVPMLVAVYGYMIYFAVRYRHRPDEPVDAVGSSLHDVPKLEAAWTIIPSLLMLVLGILSYIYIGDYWGEAQAGTPAIEAIGHTWYFEFRYPGLKNSVLGELHLPVGQPVTMYVTSAERNEQDAVLHSFWVPEFRIKQDMNPGMLSPIHFTPTRIGTYQLVCTVFCGRGHADMRAKAFVQSRADFDKWFEQQKQSEATSGGQVVATSSGSAATGQKIFTAKCAVCHSTGAFDERKVGPGLGNLFKDPKHPTLLSGKPATPDGVAAILRNGLVGDMGTMPNMQTNGLSQKDVVDLVAYLASLHK